MKATQDDCMQMLINVLDAMFVVYPSSMSSQALCEEVHCTLISLKGSSLKKMNIIGTHSSLATGRCNNKINKNK